MATIECKDCEAMFWWEDLGDLEKVKHCPYCGSMKLVKRAEDSF